MNDVFCVHIFEPKADLADVERGLKLLDFPFLADLHEGSIRHNFKNEIDTAVITKKAINRCEMSVLQEGLNLNFPYQLFFQFLFDDLLLLEFFKNYHQASDFLLGKEHVSEGPFPYLVK